MKRKDLENLVVAGLLSLLQGNLKTAKRARTKAPKKSTSTATRKAVRAYRRTRNA